MTNPELNTCESQTQCPLLFKLSTELRLMIWEYAIGDQSVQIGFQQNHLTHSICNPLLWKNRRPIIPVSSMGRHGTVRTFVCRQLRHQVYAHATMNQEHFNDLSQNVKIFDLIYAMGKTPMPPSTLGNLLLTCRQTYSETIEMLYTKSTFIFPQPWLFPCFLATISPANSQFLRSVTICLKMSDNDSPCSQNPYHDSKQALASGQFNYIGSWHHIQTSLSTMPNLRTVKVIISEPHAETYANSWRQFDHEALTKRLVEYFTKRRCRARGLKMQIYVPFVRIKYLGNNMISWETDVECEPLVRDLERKLRSRGMVCEVVAGGMIAMRKEMIGEYVGDDSPF
ncbi:hypothetical protein BU24DRAFT_455738 [Aaosphaeria arxii CBS 175.79]|uniref:DUF7730 domain-containing protein n=1 Tax=Aaosphaeria arxii CBS 175.79 TaxID=1450172 RepID=A0A6A5X8F2_9PLEO|nr:uncharacterized protein BU24DRAFT_455738 [Aaosphaeria arxii CBS 175.79]KAF2009191.1 hypothetical protein BU24DRAFT_455738 [Aaosphaeria arxii CBS 175.79]